jgi:LAO/AO transport system kinase
MTKSDSGNAIPISRYRNEILASNRIVLSQAITLSESKLPADQSLAGELIDAVLPQTGKSVRIGITGVPGVGKSTFIEAFGKHLTGLGKKVAVLTIDPTSLKTKGSILGDKTRMEELSKDPLAFIRPSASGNALGGVSHATRESVLLCEAAGFEIIIIETVGVGQSEVAVRAMVDFFLLLMLPGAGDELQGIKKGIMEMADGIAITKADGVNIAKAKQAQNDYTNALHLFQPPVSGVSPKVVTTSALEKIGISETWKMIEEFVQKTTRNGFFGHQRDEQKLEWFYSLLDLLLRNKIISHSKEKISALEESILTGHIAPRTAAHTIMEEFFNVIGRPPKQSH